MRKAYWRHRPFNLTTLPEPTKDDIEGRLVRYLSTWPEGSVQTAWELGYTLVLVAEATLRKSIRLD